MAAEYSKTIHFEGINERNLLNTCEQVISQLGFQVKSRDNAGKIIAKSRLSFFSWGEVITIELSKFSSLTEVAISSRCKLATQIVDWGKNRKNVQSIIDLIRSNQLSP